MIIPNTSSEGFWDTLSNLGYLCLGFPICKIIKSSIKISYIAEIQTMVKNQYEPANFNFHKRNLANMNNLKKETNKKQADMSSLVYLHY